MARKTTKKTGIDKEAEEIASMDARENRMKAFLKNNQQGKA